eukprot:ctg_3501.g634
MRLRRAFSSSTVRDTGRAVARRSPSSPRTVGAGRGCAQSPAPRAAAVAPTGRLVRAAATRLPSQKWPPLATGTRCARRPWPFVMSRAPTTVADRGGGARPPPSVAAAVRIPARARAVPRSDGQTARWQTGNVVAGAPAAVPVPPIPPGCVVESRRGARRVRRGVRPPRAAGGLGAAATDLPSAEASGVSPG